MAGDRGTEPGDEVEATPPASASASAQAAKIIGQVIAGRYRIDHAVATGSMGAVYRGQHVHMRNRVAIKLLHPETEGLPELVERFERESIVGAHAKHPNVASATDFGQLEDGSTYLVLEFIDGITLHQLIRLKAIEPARAVDIARQIAQGLEAIHQLDIVHRDLKPRNVMVSREPPDTVKIIDFGFAKLPVERFVADAKHAAALTSKGVVFGTVGFMAPEVTFGMHAVKAPADLYALGVMLYEMLTGKHPYDARETKKLFGCHQLDPPPSFAERAPERFIPPALEAVTMRLLEKAPGDRYESASAVIEALGAALDTVPHDTDEPRAPGAQPAPAPTTTEQERPSRPTISPSVRRRRRRRRLGALELLLGVLAIVAILLYLRPGLRAKISDLVLGRSTDSAATAATSSAAAPAPVTTATASASAGAKAGPPDRPTTVDGLDASGWTERLAKAAGSKDATQGAEALLALAAIEPSKLAAPGVLQHAAAVAVVVALGDAETADLVIERLASAELGSAGPDVLYQMAAVHGGSKGAARALELLRRKDVIRRATPALRVALELRQSPCAERPRLLDRAAREGDRRALLLLQGMRPPNCEVPGGCCLDRNPGYGPAVRKLAERAGSKPPPRP